MWNQRFDWTWLPARMQAPVWMKQHTGGSGALRRSASKGQGKAEMGADKKPLDCSDPACTDSGRHEEQEPETELENMIAEIQADETELGEAEKADLSDTEQDQLATEDDVVTEQVNQCALGGAVNHSQIIFTDQEVHCLSIF